MKNLYFLVAPRTNSPKAQSREVTLNFLLLGTILLSLASLALLLLNYGDATRDTFGARITMNLGMLVYFGGLYGLSRAGRSKLSSALLVITYFLIVIFIVSTWSIQLPLGVLMAAFVIILSGALLGSQFALISAVCSIAVMAAAFYLTKPDVTWKSVPANIGDVLMFAVIFGLIAVVCWLYDRQTERSLERAERSEAALRKQKESLEVTVQRRTKKLQAMQVEQMQQVYRFAELGLVSTAMLHDLANHLAAMSLDIEGLGSHENKDIMDRIRRTVSYIDESVHKTRDQLHGRETQEKFDATKALDEVLRLAVYRAEQQAVRLDAESIPQKPVTLFGDELRFRQFLTNIINNGIDAYEGTQTKEPRTIVTAEAQTDMFVITVTDFGKGISKAQQKHLFEPFYSTKSKGMGLGLFTAKDIIEKSFGGRILLTSDKRDGTVFTVSIPRHRSA